jgi:hypothetical protein
MALSETKIKAPGVLWSVHTKSKPVTFAMSDAMDLDARGHFVLHFLETGRVATVQQKMRLQLISKMRWM